MSTGTPGTIDRLAFTEGQWEQFDKRQLQRLEIALGITVEELFTRDHPGDAEQAGVLLGLAMLSQEDVDHLEALFTRARSRAIVQERAACMDACLGRDSEAARQ